MGKPKKGKKRNTSEIVHAKKSVEKVNPFASAKPTAATKLNPFEVHVNKEKFQILGRTCKHDKGLPGVSRGKAAKKRKETLGQEYLEKHKSNKFRDRRIGRHLHSSELNDDILNARFIAEKMSQMKQGKASRFNLNDDVVLTHKGQTLEEIEQFHDDRSDDDDVDNESLNADFTEAAHFGGENDGRDRQSAIDEMIMEQKKRKLEIAKEKDQLHTLTEKLDASYKDIAGLMNKATKSELKEKPAPDDYDKILREMIFEPRGVVTDKLLSEEELAKRERERLERLERERIKRMQAEEDGDAQNDQPKHRSADDLDDGYFVYEEEEQDLLAYNLDGNLNTKANENVNESNDEDDGHLSEEGEEHDSEEDESDEENDESVDNLSDFKESDSGTDTEDNKVENETSSNKIKKLNRSKPIIDLKLPYEIDMPSSYKNFINLIQNHTAEDQAILVERIIKCNHPKLDGVNRENVNKLFVFLLQYINDLFGDANEENVAQSFKILSCLNPHMYDLLHLNPEKTSAALLSVIGGKYSEFRKNEKVIPPLEVLVYLKLVSNYYSTSDFRHPVVTPCYIFIEHILSRARVRSRRDVARALFLVTIVAEFSHQSKRFLPGALNLLHDILKMSISSSEKSTTLSFQKNKFPLNLLVIQEQEITRELEEELLKSEDLVTDFITLEFKVRALNMTLKLIDDIISNLKDNVGSNYLAKPFLDSLKNLPLEKYPDFVKKSYETVMKILQEVASKTMVLLMPPTKKPRALRLLEPRIEVVYDDKRRPKLTKEKEERVKLIHKLKRETKGAIREIRRDTEFIQKMRINQQIQSDLERKEKVKRIYQEASMQQGELNEMARAKKKKKF